MDLQFGNLWQSRMHRLEAGKSWHNPDEKQASSNCKSSGDGDGRRKWMQGMDREMWRRQKLKDLNVDLKREGGARVWSQGDVEMESH